MLPSLALPWDSYCKCQFLLYSQNMDMLINRSVNDNRVYYMYFFNTFLVVKEEMAKSWMVYVTKSLKFGIFLFFFLNGKKTNEQNNV